MQCLQLQRLLVAEGIDVRLVQTNAPYRPRWVAGMRGIRAIFRLAPYLLSLWKAAGRVDVVHLLANSGWSWHLCAAPAVWIARLRGVPVIVNYRGGDAERFFGRRPFLAAATMQAADARVVPSGFLQRVFERWNIDTQIIPNVVDLGHFRPATGTRTDRRNVIVTRNLERIYDVPTAMRAFALVRPRFHGLTLTIAGEGPERAELEALATELGIAEHTRFAGRLDRQRMAELYAGADVMLNPSTVDNMPNSILEAYASCVPVVSTDVGGVRYIARDRETAILVPPSNPQAMAEALHAILSEPALGMRLAEQGMREVRRYAWSEVRAQWLPLYEQLASRRAVTAAEG